MRFGMCFLGFLLSVGCAVGVGEGGGQEAADPEMTDGAPQHDAMILPHADGGAIDAPSTVTQDAAQTVTVDSSTCLMSLGVLTTYDFSGQPGNQASTAATSTMAGLTAGAVSRSSSISATAGADSINASDWSTSTVDPTRYYTFTLTPPSSCALDITSITIDTKASSTGPASGAIATSADKFATTTTFTPGTSATVSLSVSGSTSPVEVRIYGYDASGTLGTWRVETTLTASGAIK